MKTFPAPHNPYAINPGPGYRILACCEKLKPTDEWHQPQPASAPDTWHLVTKESGYSSHRVYRRAINIDDQWAPPPEEFTHPNRHVLSIDERAKGPQYGERYEYWWVAGRMWKACGNGQTFDTISYYRQLVSVSQSQVPTVPPANPRPNLKPGQSIIISVGSSHALSLAVQQVAFAAGIKWANIGESVIAAAIAEGKSVVLIFAPGKPLQWDVDRRPGYTGWSDALYLDARTDMGVLIDLLAAPTVPTKLVGPAINGYVGEYVRGTFGSNDIVRFGCADIGVNMLRAARSLFDIRAAGNRTAVSIGLSSGVVLKADDVIAILKYVDQVNRSIG